MAYFDFFRNRQAMIEKTIIRDGERIVEVRSEGGKLLFIKTRQGYEMKCPRTKKICLVSYREMFSDCLSCWAEVPAGEGNPFFGEKSATVGRQEEK